MREVVTLSSVEKQIAIVAFLADQIHYSRTTLLFQNYGKFKKLEYEQKVPDMHRQRWETGDWTDDSDQMILIMQSLRDNDGKVIELSCTKCRGTKGE